jgi:hypothetical protein
VATAVDAVLRGEEPSPELRSRDVDGQIQITQPTPRDITPSAASRRGQAGGPARQDSGRVARSPATLTNPRRIFPFGVSRNRLEDAIGNLGVPAVIVRDMQEAQLVMTLKNYYRQNIQRLRQAEERGIPVYVLRNNTVTQMERQLANIFNLRLDAESDTGGNGQYEYVEEPSLEDVLLDTETAITEVMNGQRDTVELAPQNSYIRRLQHQLADRYNLRSESRGIEPHRRVRISR